MKNNLILNSDAYKFTHWLQYPQNTTKVYSYIESRGCDDGFLSTKFFGLQGFLKEYLVGDILNQEMVDEARDVLHGVFGFDYFNHNGWTNLVKKYNGKLPVFIRAVPEGSEVPFSHVLLTVENTDPQFPWVTQWLETMLLRAIWYPTTVCTVSKRIKDIYADFSEKCGALQYHPFILNDFGARGVSSHESAGIFFSAHLFNFAGSDTIEGLLWANKYYGKATLASVFATEHASTTIYTEIDEINAYETFLNKCPDNAIISIVIDSYNTERAVKEFLGNRLKQKILKRSGKTVFRPDSGNPVEMSLKVIEWLWDCFGGTINKKGFKVLNPKVGCIYGDGINPNSIRNILTNLINNKFSVENIVFGMGGKLLQAGIDRDLFKFAGKCSYAEVGGKPVDVYKDPITDKGKISKRGKLELINYNNNIFTCRQGEWPFGSKLLLRSVFRDGELLIDESFDTIRSR